VNRPAPKRVLDEAQFVQLRDLIHEASGIYFNGNKRYLLESRLQDRLKARGLHSFEEYLYFLKFDGRRSEELKFVFNVITTNETSFYRNPPQMEAFANSILPALIARKRAQGSYRIRMWSAGCSSGEEPYSMAMLVRNTLGSALRDFRVEIHGTDISTEMLERAEAGVYSNYTLRSLPGVLKEQHFVQTAADAWQINSNVREMVRFAQLNLNDAERLRTMRGFDIIFCRNVLIYFDMDAKKRFVSAFYDALVPGGTLLLGHAESLHNVSRAFRLEYFEGALAYRKEE